MIYSLTVELINCRIIFCCCLLLCFLPKKEYTHFNMPVTKTIKLRHVKGVDREINDIMLLKCISAQLRSISTPFESFISFSTKQLYYQGRP